MRQFGQGAAGSMNGAGTFMELRVQNAKEIQVFSAVPGEKERLIPQNTCFRVLQALSAADVRLLEAFGTLVESGGRARIQSQGLKKNSKANAGTFTALISL